MKKDIHILVVAFTRPILWKDLGLSLTSNSVIVVKGWGVVWYPNYVL